MIAGFEGDFALLFYVDAQNSYDAFMQSACICTIKKDEGKVATMNMTAAVEEGSR